MASIAAFVYFWSSAYEVSGGCATDTLYPFFLRILATASQPEPSAKAPCTKTTFLTCCFMRNLLCDKTLLGSSSATLRYLDKGLMPAVSAIITRSTAVVTPSRRMPTVGADRGKQTI